MVMCAVYGCSNCSRKSSSLGISFYSIPKVITNQCEKTLLLSKKRRALWIKAINRKDLQEKDVTKDTKVCCNHFVSGSPSYLMLETDPDWVPSLNLGYSNVAGTSVEVAKARHERSKERSAKKRVLQEVNNNDNAVANEENHVIRDEPVKFKDAAVQTDLTVEELNLMEGVAKASAFTPDSLEGDNYKVKYYTGLHGFDLLNEIFVIVSAHIVLCNRTALTKFQEFVIVLMRLRLNLQEEDLGYRFGVDQSTISRIIDRWLPTMCHVLSNFIVWPDRETLRKTMPECFQEAFGNSVTVIIDCFEVFCERPSSFLPRAQTFSSYKHHNTVKFLLCITPQGTVSMVSLAWGGRSSDKFITEHSGFLEHLIPGDVILADRGFDISQTIGLLHARVLVPAFKGVGRQQLSADEVDMTREIAHVRIHVERVIGLIRRKFKVLGGTIHHSWLQPVKGESLTRIDQAARVCCALSNLCPPIVPMTSDSEVDDLAF